MADDGFAAKNRRRDDNPRQDIATAFGSAVHSVVERYVKASGEILESEKVIQEISSHLRVEWGDKMIRYDRITPDFQTAVVQCEVCASGIIAEIRRRGALREDALTEQFNEGVIGGDDTHRYYLQGSADLVVGGWVMDYKTGQQCADTPAQLGAYLMLAYPRGDEWKRLAAAHINARRGGKRGEVTVREYTAENAVAAARLVLRRIQRDVEAVYHGGYDAVLPNPHSTLCNAKYCSLFGDDCAASKAHSSESVIIFGNHKKEKTNVENPKKTR